MYCRHCGARIPADSLFCPACGGRQTDAAPPRAGLDSAWIVLALILFFPLGLVLMWTHSTWSSNAKLAVTGLIFPPLWLVVIWRKMSREVQVALAGLLFPPLWGYLIWKRPWERALRLLLIVLLDFLGALWFSHFWGVTGAIVSVILTAFITLAYLAEAGNGSGNRAEREAMRALSRAIEAKLDSCHDLIAQIEDSHVFDFMPAGARERRQYVHALEMRSEGVRLFEQAESRPDLAAAEQRIEAALERLRRTRDEVTKDDRALRDNRPDAGNG